MLDSILAQDYTNFELLIVDDGSSDNSVNILEKYSKKHEQIQFWDRGKKWLIDQYNFLISQVSTDSRYITWLDTDDVYRDNNLSVRLSLFEKYPDVKMIYNNLDYMNEVWEEIHFSKNHNDFLLKCFPWYREKIHTAEIFNFMLFSGYKPPLSYGSLMFEKQALLDIGISNPSQNEFFFMWDLDIFFRAVSLFPTYGTQQKLLKYRVHDHQVTCLHTKQMHKDMKGILHQLYKDVYISPTDFTHLYKKNND